MALDGLLFAVDQFRMNVSIYDSYLLDEYDKAYQVKRFETV
jgi:hypothetical protein